MPTGEDVTALVARAAAIARVSRDRRAAHDAALAQIALAAAHSGWHDRVDAEHLVACAAAFATRAIARADKPPLDRSGRADAGSPGSRPPAD